MVARVRFAEDTGWFVLSTDGLVIAISPEDVMSALTSPGPARQPNGEWHLTVAGKRVVNVFVDDEGLALLRTSGAR